MEISNNKTYRECKVSFEEFNLDMINNYNEIKFTDLE